MSKAFSHTLGVLVQIFFFSAVFVGLALHLNSEFFQKVAIEFSPAPATVASHSSTKVEGHTTNHSGEVAGEESSKFQQFHQEIVQKVAAFDPFVAFIPTVDENKKSLELPFVFVSSDRDYLQAKAVEFCLENYHILSITDLSKIQSQCVVTVVDLVLARLRSGKTFTFQEILRRSEEKRAQQTSSSSSPSSPSSPFSSETVTDVAPPKDIARVPGTESNYAVRIYSTSGQFYDVTFDLQHTSPRKIASYFCAQKANELKATTASLLTTCTEQVEQYVLQKLREINATIPDHMISQTSSASSSTTTTTATSNSETPTISESFAGTEGEAAVSAPLE